MDAYLNPIGLKSFTSKMILSSSIPSFFSFTFFFSVQEANILILLESLKQQRMYKGFRLEQWDNAFLLCLKCYKFWTLYYLSAFMPEGIDTVFQHVLMLWMQIVTHHPSQHLWPLMIYLILAVKLECSKQGGCKN